MLKRAQATVPDVDAVLIKLNFADWLYQCHWDKLPSLENVINSLRDTPPVLILDFEFRTEW